MPHELIKNKNIIVLEWRLFILCYNKEPFLDQIIMCDKNRIYTTADNSLSMIGLISTKTFLKTKLAPKKVIITVWWSTAGLIHYSFLNPSKIITSEKYAQEIYEMHWKLQYMQLALVNRQGPTHLHDNTWLSEPSHQGFKSWTNWAMNLCLICHIHLTSY